MLKKIIIILTLVASLAACKSKSKAAFNYSNDIASKEKSLKPDVKTTEDNVKKYYEAQQFDSIAMAGENMEGILQKTIDEINAMPVPKVKEADNFKIAVMRYFKFFKSLYTDYKEFGRAGTDEKRQVILQDIQKIVGEKQENLDAMQKAQQKFADANGFRVESKTY